MNNWSACWSAYRRKRNPDSGIVQALAMIAVMGLAFYCLMR